MKRTFDIVASCLGLAFSWPLILAIILAIRCESNGNPIFAQTRVGRHQRPFTCYKIRTMYLGTSNLPTHQVDASAVTRLGKIIRRLKLDELPQLWNVLTGEMSLVGPRPCLPSQFELVEARQRLGVFEVSPGVTGLAQVRGIDMSNPAQLAQVDAEYVRSRSVRNDIKLIIATLTGEGVGADRTARNHV